MPSFAVALIVAGIFVSDPTLGYPPDRTDPARRRFTAWSMDLLHHLFTGVPHHQALGQTMGASRLGTFDGEATEKAV